MRGNKAILAVVALALIVGLTSAANASSVLFLGVGSSAQFNSIAVGAFTDLCSSRAGSDCHHYSIKGVNKADGQNWAQAIDSRNASIPVEGGNLWVVWDNNTNPITVWAYLSVDTIVGDRLFFAVPRATLQVDSGVTSTPGMNLVPAAIMFNHQTGTTQADDASLPNAVLTLVQTTFTAGVTDVRVEDAKYETNRILAAYNVNGNGLGYNNGAAASCGATYTVSNDLGCPILGTWGSKATPVQFAISGKDPFTGGAAWKYETIDVGAAPIVFVYNATDPNGLGALGPDGDVAFKNMNHFTGVSVFNGSLGRAQDLDPSLTTALQKLGSNPSLNVILREPLSGTFTTTEFNFFRTTAMLKLFPKSASMETGIDIRNSCTQGTNCPNPLALPGPGGSYRYRGIGTGQVIGGNNGQGGVLHLADSVTYTFWGFGNVNPVAGTQGVGRYITYDGVDPFNATYGPYTFQGTNYAPGQLPLCTAPCGGGNGGWVLGTSFPNVRNGSYPGWSILRVVTDASGPNKANTEALVAASQTEIGITVPDYVPVSCVGADCTDSSGNKETGLAIFRSHFKIAGVTKGTISNGNPGEKTENGGDVAGGVFTVQADTDYFNDTGSQLIGYRQ